MHFGFKFFCFCTNRIETASCELQLTYPNKLCVHRQLLSFIWPTLVNVVCSQAVLTLIWPTLINFMLTSKRGWWECISLASVDVADDWLFRIFSYVKLFSFWGLCPTHCTRGSTTPQHKGLQCQTPIILTDSFWICLWRGRRDKNRTSVLHCVRNNDGSCLTLSLPIQLRLYILPYWSNPLFFIFDIRALWHSGVSARVPECQK